MPDVVDALVAVLETGKRLKKPDPFWVPRLDTATGDARRLLDAIANHDSPSWEIGSRFIADGAGTFAGVAKNLKTSFAFDTEKSCALGSAYGDLHAWGFKWDARKLEFLEVDSKGKATIYTPAAWLAHLVKDETAIAKEHDNELTDELVDFLAAAGKPVKASAAKTKAKTKTTKTKPKAKAAPNAKAAKKKR